jgi:NAD(P)-dependent dehydrogenase (short-subunit alcohol dehydrogenase family)
MDDVKRLIAERAPKCRVVCIPLDLVKNESCQSLIEQHVKAHGKLDTLVLNHGTQEVQDEIEDLSEEQWLHTFDVNIHPFFYLCKSGIQHMPRGATIIMNASVNPFKGHPKLMDYTATKGAIVGFARALSNNILKSRGIRVNGGQSNTSSEACSYPHD